MRRPLSLVCLASLSVLASCATPFDQRWSNTPAPMASNPAALMDGKWEGTWQSDSTNYQGHLQSIITLTGPAIVDKQAVQQYVATVELRLFEFPFKSYDIKLNAIQKPDADGRIHFDGMKDLGYSEGGLFRYSGYIDPASDEFFCEYNSDKDVGTFKMRRITLENQ